MGITITGGVNIPAGAGTLTISNNTPPAWTTAAGSLGSLFEPNTVTSTGYETVATDVDATDTIAYSLYSGELPNSAASGDITFTGQPNANDSIVVNGNTWTFVASGATGNQSNIGGTLALTLDNLVLSLNASAIASLTPATYTNDGLKFIVHHDTPGTGGNSFI